MTIPLPSDMKHPPETMVGVGYETTMGVFNFQGWDCQSGSHGVFRDL